jgi:hypothetical protein
VATSAKIISKDEAAVHGEVVATRGIGSGDGWSGRVLALRASGSDKRGNYA